MHAMRPLITSATVSLLMLLASTVEVLPRGRRYDSIFSFGDSFADTGNDIVVSPAVHSLANPSSRPPYGMTFFGHPTGRNSNGRLIIDFIAEDLGLPLVPPFLAHTVCFREGANFASTDPADYDSRTGCLKQFNNLAVYHNSRLQAALKRVQRAHTNARVIYADFFSPVTEMVEYPSKFGFTRDVLKCCCGGGGKYNFNMSAGCGMPGATVCQDPSAYLFWDGHLTEAAYRYIAKGWLDGINNCDV